jgi:UPF0176 protein
VAYIIASFYHFVSLSNPASLREELFAAFGESDLRGTLLIAGEGVNGTLVGPGAVIDDLLCMLADKIGLDRADVKFASSDVKPFRRLKFRVKPEIIAFRKAKVDPTQSGRYVDPGEWNAVIDNNDVLLLDTRNHYETDLGTFAGATAPGIETFSDFVTYVRENLDPVKQPKVAMFCTGGIRCEKASAFMLQEGFSEVYHLKGGILKYLEEVPQQSSRWSGSCYVFDSRTSVQHLDYDSRKVDMGAANDTEGTS